MIRYYIRVSTIEQNTIRQDKAISDYLKAKGLPTNYTSYIDKASGKNMDRPQLKAMLEDLKADDIVIVKSLDRLSRSTKDLLNIVDCIENKNATLLVIDKNIDTKDSYGRFFITILGALAELERTTIVNRVKEGVAIAKEEGKYKGRKQGSIKLHGAEELKQFIRDYKAGINKKRLSEIYGVPRTTIYRWIKTLQDRELIN